VERNTARTQSSLQLGSMLQSWLSDIPRFQDSQGGCPPLSREGVVGAAASILELNTVPVIWTIKPAARSNVKAPPEIPSSNSRILHQAPAGNPKPLLLGGSLPLVKLWHVAGQVPPMEVRGAQGNEEQWDTKNLDANCEPVTSSHSPTAANVPAAFHPYLYRCREPLAPHLQVCFPLDTYASSSGFGVWNQNHPVVYVVVHLDPRVELPRLGKEFESVLNCSACGDDEYI
jgi:hypothetical protein